MVDAKPSSSEAALRTRSISKYYGDFAALDDVSLQVDEGEMFGLLGPNGAGKSTLMRILTTVAEPSSGDAWVAGYNVLEEPKKVRRHISYIPQETALDDWMTARETLDLFGRFYSVPPAELRKRIGTALERVDLTDEADDEIRTFSGGMKRRLEIASALIHHPSVIILDEPTIGLDPHMRQEIWKYVKKIRREGATVIISTHYMDEADTLCDRVAIIDDGQIRRVDSPQHLKEQLTEGGTGTLDSVFLELTRDDGVRSDQLAMD